MPGLKADMKLGFNLSNIFRFKYCNEIKPLRTIGLQSPKTTDWVNSNTYFYQPVPFLSDHIYKTRLTLLRPCS